MDQTPKSTQEALAWAIKNDVYRHAVENALNHIIITDLDGKVIYANKGVTRITGFSQEEVLGQNPSLWGKLMPPEFYKQMWQTIKVDKKPFEGEVTNHRKNGEHYIAHAVISPVFDDQNNLIAFIGTEEDITKQKEVDKMKTDFISITAHQLKTPLTEINWTIESVDDKIASTEPDLRNALNQIHTISQSMTTLVDLLLNITRLEAGRMTIEPTPTDLELLAKSEFHKVGLEADKKQIKIGYQFDPDHKNLSIDPNLISQVFHNLYTNAIKYGLPNSILKVGSKLNGNFLTFSVSNQGLGIPKDEQTKIFAKYYRASTATKNQIEGNGLGLYFVQQIIIASGGKIWFESIPNEITTFYFDLPLSGSPAHTGQVKAS